MNIASAEDVPVPIVEIPVAAGLLVLTVSLAAWWLTRV
jgi:hypothetical protein